MIVTCLIFSNSCKKEDQSVIDPAFQEYVDRFVTEADLRNVKIDISKLKVTYGDTLKYYCGYGLTNDVVIRSYCWENSSDINKEILLFHELGHAILGRMHDNTILPNGDFTTIMAPNGFYSCYSEFTPEKRKYYLDILFIPSSPQPDWAVERKTAKVILMDTINAASNSWLYFKSPGCTSKGEISSSVFVSPGTCLAIKSDSPSTSTDDFSYWVYTLIPQGIKQSTKLVLQVKIKLDNVTDKGVYFAIRGNANPKFTFFSTTQGVKDLSGTSDFIEYAVEIPYYISLTESINLFLILNGKSTGTAYFDDITLVNYE